jgi:hypothetical protein
MISEPSHVPCVSASIFSLKCGSDFDCLTQKDATYYDRCDCANESASEQFNYLLQSTL